MQHNFKVGDKVRRGPRTHCGCGPSQPSKVWTIQKLRKVRPSARHNGCNECGESYEIPADMIIAELEEHMNCPVVRLLPLNPRADKRVLLT